MGKRACRCFGCSVRALIRLACRFHFVETDSGFQHKHNVKTLVTDITDYYRDVF